MYLTCRPRTIAPRARARLHPPDGMKWPPHPPGQALRSAGRAGCETCVQRSCVQSVLDGEALETRPLFSGGPLCRMEPLRVGQAGPHQVDGPAQVRVGFGLEAIGPCEALVELVHR